MFPVLIGTNPERTDWLADCLASVKATTDRDIIIHNTGGYEINALRTGVTRADRFLYIHDSVTILKPEFWDHIQNPCWLTAFPPMHMGVFDSAELAPWLEHFPTEMTKEQAIEAEAALYWALPQPILFPDVHDHNALRTEYRHGRNNLILGNDLFEKAKGTWR